MEFNVVLERDSETGIWVVEAPGIPGCYTQGNSREEALANIREVIQLLKETDGLPSQPQPQVELAKVRVEA